MPQKSTLPNPNPSGLCLCGCGQATPIARVSKTAKNIVVGCPVRYLTGHHKRKPLTYVVDPVTGCWNWQGSKQPGGYGRFHRDGKVLNAHRYFYERVHGPIPDGMEPDHLCYNPSCINPDHIEIVTPAVNTQRKRTAKLTAEKVASIRSLKGAMTHRALAQRFGISRSHVTGILLNQVWKEEAVA